MKSSKADRNHGTDPFFFFNRLNKIPFMTPIRRLKNPFYSAIECRLSRYLFVEMYSDNKHLQEVKDILKFAMELYR